MNQVGQTFVDQSFIDQSLTLDREAYHGGLDLRELASFGLGIDDVVDFSSNILPHGPSPKVIAAIASAVVDRYPDRESDALKSAISEVYDIAADRLLVGNGCSELIHLIAASLLEPGDHALVVGPTFSEYARATLLSMATVEHCDALSTDQFAVRFSSIDERLEQQRFKMMWICNPNNPTAQVVPCARLIDWLERYPDTFLIVDESYIEFSENADSMLRYQYANLVILRSMTKSFAIAGVRLGFAVLAKSMCDRLCGRRVPWNISSLAQAAGIAALQDRAYYEKALGEVRESKAELIADLTSGGFHVLPGDANFFLLRTTDASALREKLLLRGLVVRDCASFGLHDCLRIAVRDRTSNRRLVDAMFDRVDEVETVSEFEPVSDKSPLRQTSYFDAAFTQRLNELFRKRRDVRRFCDDPIPASSLERWVESACLAPSVGLSQPWRFVSVKSSGIRDAVIDEFEQQNRLAGERYDDVAVAKKYRELKLAGLKEAPEHLAVFVEPDPELGRGLGRLTMPESVVYSVVAAIQNLWLAARAEGVGVGWVSILRPEQIVKVLNVPDHWQLVAYLCIGWPQVEDEEVPELEQAGWERRVTKGSTWTHR
jgi:L-threonine-O-3-phosphate decarboxylase/5,6-dimethylbenzimidazole synthase